MDAIVLVKDRNWTGTDSHTLEIPVDRLATTALRDWSELDDDRFAGQVLPEPLRGRYFRLLEQDDDPPVAAWYALVDDIWETVRNMGLEERADWFVELHDPVTIKARYWVHDGVDYLDAAHTVPRDE